MNTGYARVWTGEQPANRQLAVPTRADCGKICRQTTGVAPIARESLKLARGPARAGDTLAVRLRDRRGQSLAQRLARLSRRRILPGAESRPLYLTKKLMF